MSAISDDVFCLQLLEDALRALRGNKEKQPDDKKRAWAVTITELEKAIAYFKTFVIEE